MESNQDYTEELRQILGNRFDEFFPHGIGETTRETFQSQTFREAAFHTMPDRYGPGDGFLYTVMGGVGVTFVVKGRVAPRNPYDVMHASFGGMDWRPNLILIFKYDGEDTITSTNLETGETRSQTGQYGKPDDLLPRIKSSLGTLVSE